MIAEVSQHSVLGFPHLCWGYRQLCHSTVVRVVGLNTGAVVKQCPGKSRHLHI